MQLTLRNTLNVIKPTKVISSSSSMSSMRASCRILNQTTRKVSHKTSSNLGDGLKGHFSAQIASRMSCGTLRFVGLTPDIIDIYPEATVVGSKVALMYLKSLTHRPFEQQVVKGGDKIDLGGGHVVEFIMAPNLHWPDTIFSFDHATGEIPAH